MLKMNKKGLYLGNELKTFTNDKQEDKSYIVITVVMLEDKETYKLKFDDIESFYQMSLEELQTYDFTIGIKAYVINGRRGISMKVLNIE